MAPLEKCQIYYIRAPSGVELGSSTKRPFMHEMDDLGRLVIDYYKIADFVIISIPVQ